MRSSLPGSTSLTLGRTSRAERSSLRDLLLEGAQVVHPAVEERFRHLDVHFEGVERALAIEHDLVVRLDALDLEQHLSRPPTGRR